MIRVGRVAFAALVAQALDAIPPALGEAMENVAVVVEPEPPAGQEDLLGLYEGTPLTERGNDYSGTMPDVIHIFAGPICRLCQTEAEVISEVIITVIHEVAHHFGLDDDELHDLGWS